MAKKIIIDFSAQPITTGQGFLYSIQVDGFDMNVKLISFLTVIHPLIITRLQ